MLKLKIFVRKETHGAWMDEESHIYYYMIFAKNINEAAELWLKKKHEVINSRNVEFEKKYIREFTTPTKVGIVNLNSFSPF